MSEEAKKAFVVMQFKDGAKKFEVIEECLNEAGYDVIRADKVRTSGYVAQEMYDDLRTSDLVVIDTSGDSLNVAYELGYCHGCGRQSNEILLLHEGDGNNIPFDYRQFRHRCYKNMAELKREIRYWFDITKLLTGDQVGYAFNFIWTSGASAYGFDVAKAIIEALEPTGFSGRCEYYDVDFFIEPNLYVVGIGLRPQKKDHKFSYEKWQEFTKEIEFRLTGIIPKIMLDSGNSEFGKLAAFRQNLLYCGSAEFRDGKPYMILNKGKEDSWYIAALHAIQKDQPL